MRKAISSISLWVLVRGKKFLMLAAGMVLVGFIPISYFRIGWILAAISIWYLGLSAFWLASEDYNESSYQPELIEDLGSVFFVVFFFAPFGLVGYLVNGMLSV